MYARLNHWRKLLPVVALIGCLGVAPIGARAQSAARTAGYLYLSPVPSAPYVSDQTHYILVRFTKASPLDITNLLTDFITVTAESSGPHSGTTRIASDGRTVIFEMAAAFSMNELATVTLNPGMAANATASAAPYQYQFMVTAPMPNSVPLAALAVPDFLAPGPVASEPKVQPRISAKQTRGGIRPKAMRMSNGVSVPGDFPQVVITVNNNPSPGYLFLENALYDVPPYTMILDNNGLPVWYQRGRYFDFKIQKNGLMTWGNYDDAGLATFYAFDQNFNHVQTFVTTNGYTTDGHDLKILPDGRYFMIGSRDNTVDLSQYMAGGSVVDLTETVVQGFTAAGELIFQWRAWDNYDVRDLVPAGNSDFAHMNGIDIDEDGNLLVSARHLSEVTKINLDSGDIMWRLGGAHNNFSFVNDPFYGPSYQHNISALGNGHYMVFDNGDFHPTLLSRAVEYQLDLTSMTATMVWQFRDTPDKYAYWMGNAQRLPSGNTFIDFVRPEYPKAIEVDSNGVKQFELSLVPSSDSYRAFRFPWNGVVAAPYLILDPQPDNITLIFNKFGDTNVAYYRIYSGPSPHPTTVLAESTTTLKKVSSLQNGLYYFRVTAVSPDGVESPFSNEESLNVNILQPGQNIVQNGNFVQGTNAWTLNLSGTASASWAVDNTFASFYVANGGISLSSVQLLQGGLGLIQGNKYVLDFDAWSSQSQYIGVQLAQSSSPFIDYSQIRPPFLTPRPNHYRYAFMMQQPSDLSANLLFNLGSSASTVFLANISLISSPPGDLNLDGRVDVLDLSIFVESWLKQANGLPADLNGDGKVDFNDFSILGANYGRGTP